MSIQYNLIKESITEGFSRSRKKVQVMGGGFANGKTAAAVVLKILVVAKDYPGANILVARSTLPKLNDTIRKEFAKWCPKSWIKSFPQPAKDSSTCKLKNGTEINFRYIAQQGKSNVETTSNLLSATYDLIVVDQVEDPEIILKDYDDLMGRLRGSTPYAGDDPTMPVSGPRWIVLTCNPTGNWFYQSVVRPLHQYQDSLKRGTSFISKDLLCVRDPVTGEPILDDDGKPELLIDLFEGSTYENSQNLPDDFIQLLESRYQGQMKERFLLGRWAAFEGLVYPGVTIDSHSIPQEEIIRYLIDERQFEPANLHEGYDHGIAVPGCYLLGLEDRRGNFFIVDGDYSIKSGTDPWVTEVFYRRQKHFGSTLPSTTVNADPAIFRRTGSLKKTVGPPVAKLFQDEGLRTKRGNNDFKAGHQRLTNWMNFDKHHSHPISGEKGAPHFYVAEELEFWWNEIANYYWKKNTQTGEWQDEPMDRNDHSMDATRYLITDLGEPFLYIPVDFRTNPMFQWHEIGDDNGRRSRS